MKKLATILLLHLMLLPVVWNGIGLWHYIVAHTHTFCAADLAEHTHQTPEGCISIFQLENNQPNQQLPTTNEYYELKTCITSNTIFNTLLLCSIKQTDFIEPFSLNNHYFNEIFHPPIG